MSDGRAWMYHRLDNGFITHEFINGVEEFVNFAKMHPECMCRGMMRCPCNHRKCRNKAYYDEDTVKVHLGKFGFVPDYHRWYHHGESYWVEPSSSSIASDDFTSQHVNEMQNMINDAYNSVNMGDEPQSPNQNAKNLYEMLKASETEVWQGNPYGHSQLSAVARLLNIKAEHHISERCYDDICQLMSELLPADHCMTDGFYNTKKLIRGLGLPVEKIDCCNNNCMIFWGDDAEINECRFCKHPRYKPTTRRAGINRKSVPWKRMYYFPLTPRLQRLYASEKTAKHMRWHFDHTQDGDSMCHPSDSPAWKHFDTMHPEFSSEVRNVRLALSADGFQPFGQSGQQYSSWPVILTPYNLPPWMCMKDEYMFLTVIIPGPSNPKDKLDVFLQPLIAELKDLWTVGAQTYDIHSKTNFIMHASLLWTISDFPAYSMLSGWSTYGKQSCPYCMEDSDAFSLPNGGKISWFDNHRKFLPHDHTFRRNIKWFRKKHKETKNPPHLKSGEEIIDEIESYGLRCVTGLGASELNSEIVRRCKCGWKRRSIFWKLPYWKTNLIRHNLDVMHIEKNFFENILNTVLNVPGRTKDNAKSREDLKLFCSRPELHRDETTNTYPKACYTLDKHSKLSLCNWLKELKFPDGYASKLARCVDINKLKMFGMKSHDCHIFMQRLIPIAFRELLPNNVWHALTELSLFFKDLTARIVKCSDMSRLENDIPVILCKLERIFPPSFFDSMEHLPVHLAYEARIAGPVQYRWMYPFERFLRRLKNNVRNKARVEGSICNAYLVEEASLFCSHYFSGSVKTRLRKQPRNDETSQIENEDVSSISVFKFSGRAMGAARSRWLDDTEYHAARTYILLNCEEVKPYVSIFEAELRWHNPSIDARELDARVQTEFAAWFERHVQHTQTELPNQCLKHIARGPLHKVKSYAGYYVNGFRFHAMHYGSTRSTSNAGVSVKGSSNMTTDLAYYGNIEEIIEVEFPGLPIKRIVMFKCAWFDPTPRSGTRYHHQYKLVDVNKNKRLNIYEPFVFAVQAVQVFYATYPNARRASNEWLAVCKMQARSYIQLPESGSISSIDERAFQDEEVEHHGVNVEDLTISHSLVDVNILYEEIDELGQLNENEIEVVISSEEEEIEFLDEDLVDEGGD